MNKKMKNTVLFLFYLVFSLEILEASPNKEEKYFEDFIDYDYNIIFANRDIQQDLRIIEKKRDSQEKQYQGGFRNGNGIAFSLYGFLFDFIVDTNDSSYFNFTFDYYDNIRVSFINFQLRNFRLSEPKKHQIENNTHKNNIILNDNEILIDYSFLSNGKKKVSKSKGIMVAEERQTKSAWNGTASLLIQEKSIRNLDNNNLKNSIYFEAPLQFYIINPKLGLAGAIVYNRLSLFSEFLIGPSIQWLETTIENKVYKEFSFDNLNFNLTLAAKYDLETWFLAGNFELRSLYTGNNKFELSNDQTIFFLLLGFRF